MRQEKKNQRGITSAIFSAVFDSRSSFFAPKPHGNACYVGYLYLFLIGLHLPSRNCPYTMFVFVHFENESMCYLCEIYRSHDLLRPHPHVSTFVWKQRFFSPVWPTVHTFPVKMVTENAFFKNIKKNPPECSEGFWQCLLLVRVWTDENGGFRIRWYHTSFTTSITHALWGMLSYSHIFLAFSYGRAKTSRLRYEWTPVFLKTEGEKSPF